MRKLKDKKIKIVWKALDLKRDFRDGIEHDFEMLKAYYELDKWSKHEEIKAFMNDHEKLSEFLINELERLNNENYYCNQFFGYYKHKLVSTFIISNAENNDNGIEQFILDPYTKHPLLYSMVCESINTNPNFFCCYK